MENNRSSWVRSKSTDINIEAELRYKKLPAKLGDLQFYNIDVPVLECLYLGRKSVRSSTSCHGIKIVALVAR